MRDLRRIRGTQARLAWLGSAQPLRMARLGDLIDTIESSGNFGPDTRRLLWKLRRLARIESQPALAARADYLLARHFALTGRPRVGLALLQRARQQWDAAEQPLPALRTNLGRMQLLVDSGEYREAIITGHHMLDGLEAFRTHPDHAELSGLAWLNIGACQNFLGLFRHALKSLQRAEQWLAGGNHPRALAQVQHNRGGTLKDMGQLDEALRCFRAARAGADPLLAAQITAYEGEARLLAGEYQQALHQFEQARSEFARLNASAAHADALRAIAETYLSLSLYPEALTIYEQILPFLNHGKLTDLEIRTLLGHARTLVRLNQHRRAAETLQRVITLAERTSNSYLLLLGHIQQAEMLAASGQKMLAQQMLSELELSTISAPQAALLALNRATVADDPEQAHSRLDEAERAIRDVPIPFLKQQLLTRRGAVLLSEARLPAAIAALDEAVSITEALRRGISHEPLLRTFFGDKLEAYYLLTDACLAAGRNDQALIIAEQSKARGLLQSDPIQNANQDNVHWLELSHIQKQLLEGQAHVRRSEQRRTLIRAERLLGLALLRDASREPDRSQTPLARHRFDWPTHPVVVFTQGRESLLYFLCRDGRILDSGTLCTMRELAGSVTRLREHMDRMATSPQLRSRHATAMLQHARALMQTFYRLMFAPIDEALNRPQSQRLTIVPHGVLGMLPFGALHDGDDWLIHRYCFSQTPALALLSKIRPARTTGPSRALVGTTATASIPGAAQEAQTVAELLAGAGMDIRYTDHLCTADLFDSPNVPEVLHLACHGKFRADNPMFSSLRLDDRWVTATELLARLPRGGRLAVISACESGRATWLPGNEPLGLPRAFLASGFHSVVSSLWLADDRAATTLATQFYENFTKDHDAATALQHAQRDIHCNYHDPFFWAGYVLTARQ